MTGQRFVWIGLSGIIGGLALAGVFTPASFWLTPDQQGQRLLRQHQFAQAAQMFADPLRQGVALFRAGQFKEAASAFGRVNSPEGAFNQGNAFVMAGQYEDAVRRYDRALELRPGWQTAEENREIARIRAQRMKREGGDMTGGKLGADEIVFEQGSKKFEGAQKETVEAAAAALSDQALQATWLRRVQTKPADFLRAKFAAQAATRGEEK